MEKNILNIPIVSIKQVRQSKAKYNTVISAPENIISMIDPILKNADREMLIVIGMNSGNIPNVINVVSIGTINCAPASPRDIFKALILSNSSSFICVHNHLGGTLSPSNEDRRLTELLSKVGEMLEIKLIDHLIFVDRNKYWSFHQNSVLGATG
jgi:DNA repair protein RadC